MKKFTSMIFSILTVGLIAYAQTSSANTQYSIAQLTPISSGSTTLKAIVKGANATSPPQETQQALTNASILSAFTTNRPNTIFVIDAKELTNSSSNAEENSNAFTTNKILNQALHLKAPILISNYQPKQLKYLTRGFSAKSQLALVYAFNPHDILVQTFNPAANSSKDTHTLKQTPAQIIQQIKNTLQKIQKQNQEQALKSEIDFNPIKSNSNNLGTYARETRVWKWSSSQIYPVPTSIVPGKNYGPYVSDEITQCVRFSPTIKITAAAIPQINSPSKYMSMEFAPNSSIQLETTKTGVCSDASASQPSVWLDEDNDKGVPIGTADITQEGGFINWVGITLGMPYSPNGTTYDFSPKVINQHGITSTTGWALGVSAPTTPDNNTNTPTNTVTPSFTNLTPNNNLSFSYQHPNSTVDYNDFNEYAVNNTDHGHVSWQYVLALDKKGDAIQFPDWWKNDGVFDMIHCGNRGFYLCPLNPMAYDFKGFGPTIAWHMTDPTASSQTIPLQYSINVGIVYADGSRPKIVGNNHDLNLYTLNLLGSGSVDLSMLNNEPFPTSTQDNPQTGADTGWTEVSPQRYQAFSGSQTLAFIQSPSNEKNHPQQTWKDTPIWKIQNMTASPLSLLKIKRWNSDANQFETIPFNDLYNQYPIDSPEGYKPYRLSFKGFGPNGEGKSDDYYSAYALSLYSVYDTNEKKYSYSNSFPSGKSTYFTASYLINTATNTSINTGSIYKGAANTSIVLIYGNSQYEFDIGFDPKGQNTFVWTNDNLTSYNQAWKVDAYHRIIYLGSNKAPSPTATIPKGVSVLLDNPLQDQDSDYLFEDPAQVIFADDKQNTWGSAYTNLAPISGSPSTLPVTVGEDQSYNFNYPAGKTPEDYNFTVLVTYKDQCVAFNTKNTKPSLNLKDLDWNIVINQDTKFGSDCPPVALHDTATVPEISPSSTQYTAAGHSKDLKSKGTYLAGQIVKPGYYCLQNVGGHEEQFEWDINGQEFKSSRLHSGGATMKLDLPLGALVYLKGTGTTLTNITDEAKIWYAADQSSSSECGDPPGTEGNKS